MSGRRPFRLTTTVGVRGDRDARHCGAVSYDDRVTASSVRPVVLRNSYGIEDPLRVVLGFLKAPGRFDVSDPSRSASFGEPDLRLANRGGARISAAQIGAILERRGRSSAPCSDIPPGCLAVSRGELRAVVAVEAAVRRVRGHQGGRLGEDDQGAVPEAPGADPMLDSMVQAYLRDDDLGAKAPFAERALAFVRGYQRDLDRNRAAVRAVRQDLTGRGYGLTEVRILDLLILSAQATA